MSAPLPIVAAAALLAGAAVLLRSFEHPGRRPLSPDTWYYLAYADALRRKRGWTAELPQYLLQDRLQSYPPLFPLVLSLLPGGLLRRRFELLPPLFDGLHVLLLAAVAASLGAGPAMTLLAAAILAFLPQAVAEARGLHSRSFAALLHSAAMALALGLIPAGMLAAVAAGAMLLLGSGALAVAYVGLAAGIGLAWHEPGPLWAAAGALALAFLATGGHFARVLANYTHAVRFWWKHRRQFGAHPVRHSPIYGAPPDPREGVVLPPGILGHGALAQLLRLLGENPALLAVPFVLLDGSAVLRRTAAWAGGLALLALLASWVPPLRGFGPGRTLMRASTFPTACLLAAASARQGPRSSVVMAAAAVLALSLLALALFHRRLRAQAADATPDIPEALAQAVQFLAGLPPGGVLCLPYVYAGYTCYHGGKPVLWGSHCGDHGRLEALLPVITRPITELAREYGVAYLLLRPDFARPGELGLEGRTERLGGWGPFELHALRPAAP